MMTLAIFVLVLFLYSLLSQRIEQTPITAPIVFTALGMLLSSGWGHIAGAGLTPGVFLRLAEVGLVLLLFTDSSRTDLHVLRSIGTLPGRLLSAGMLLTVVLGAVAARLIFPQLSIWEAGILSAILAWARSSSTARACRCVFVRRSTLKPD
jgi:sodium/hydrogen antiporter